MSTIDYDALLKNELFDESSLVEALSEFFSYDVKVAERFNRTVYIEMYSDEKLECGVYLIGYAADATWDSDIVNDEYLYRQCLSIALDKENADMTIVAKVMRFLLNLAKTKNLEMLVKSCVHDDICYVKNGNAVWKESFYCNYKDLI